MYKDKIKLRKIEYRINKENWSKQEDGYKK